MVYPPRTGGWSTDVHGVDSGEARWKGWTFGDMRHWTWASGTDMRHYFTQAHDTFAIIDNKQQRLAEGDSMTADLKSPAIPVAGQERVNVEFDHHYRQGKDGQNATVTVSFDGGKPRKSPSLIKTSSPSTSPLAWTCRPARRICRLASATTTAMMTGGGRWITWASSSRSVSLKARRRLPWTCFPTSKATPRLQRRGPPVERYGGQGRGAGAQRRPRR